MSMQLGVDRYQRMKNLLDKNISERMLYHNNENEWNLMYKYLVEYGEEHSNGSCNVPENYTFISTDYKEIKLGQWLTEQRSSYSSGTLTCYSHPEKYENFKH